MLQLTNIKSHIDSSAKLKFRGCNHPSQRRNQTFKMDGTESNMAGSDNNVEISNKNSKTLRNKTPSFNYLRNASQHTNLLRKRFSSPKFPYTVKEEYTLNTPGYSGRKFSDNGDKKMFSRSESLEAFPPLSKNFIKRRHSRSP